MLASREQKQPARDESGTSLWIRSLSSLVRSPSSGHLSVQVTSSGHLSVQVTSSGHLSVQVTSLGHLSVQVTFVRSPLCSGHLRRVTPLFRSPSSGLLSVQVTFVGSPPCSGHLRQVTSVQITSARSPLCSGCIRQVTSLFRSPLFFVMPTSVPPVQVQCCFTSTAIRDVHLDFHTAPELCDFSVALRPQRP